MTGIAGACPSAGNAQVAAPPMMKSRRLMSNTSIARVGDRTALSSTIREPTSADMLSPLLPSTRLVCAFGSMQQEPSDRRDGHDDAGKKRDEMMCHGAGSQRLATVVIGTRTRVEVLGSSLISIVT